MRGRADIVNKSVFGYDVVTGINTTNMTATEKPTFVLPEVSTLHPVPRPGTFVIRTAFRTMRSPLGLVSVSLRAITTVTERPTSLTFMTLDPAVGWYLASSANREARFVRWGPALRHRSQPKFRSRVIYNR